MNWVAPIVALVASVALICIVLLLGDAKLSIESDLQDNPGPPANPPSPREIGGDFGWF